MRVAILGPLEVDVDGEQVAVGGPRVRALLVRLALDAPSTVSAQALHDALWADEQPTDAANALHTVVSRLRRQLPPNASISSTAAGYRLEVDADDVDAHRFEALAERGRVAWAAGRPAEALPCLTDALALWRGSPLMDLVDADWVDAAVARLEELRLSALEDRIEAELALGHPVQPSELESLTAEHPLRERLQAATITALYVAGRQTEALTRYEETRARLADELGVDPGPQLQAAHLAVLRGEPVVAAPPTQDVRSPAHSNLRAWVSSFVGRSAEVERVGALLARSRLVTLVGPGGAGKTRLASETAGRMTDQVPQGVWVAELASVTDPDDLPQAVLTALGVRGTALLDPGSPSTERDTRTRLLETLIDSQTLLLLDNCEHLIGAVAELADLLLTRCPGLRILATSREALGIEGEELFAVPSLGLPLATASAEEALAFDAVRLFCDRAGSLRDGFTLDGGNVAAVVEICRRLDGLPLAIELAAARTRSMPVEDIAGRLSDRFRLLTGGSRTAVPRHRTLTAVVEWSWDLLSDDERVLAERLAVFPAGSTPESAAAIVGGAWDRARLDDVLAALVDKSLLTLTDDTATRYRMLETIREYGAERLVESGAIDEVRRLHATYFCELAERAEPHLRTAGQVPWFHLLAKERDNLVAALRFSVDSGDAATAVRTIAALGMYWMLRGSHSEADDWMRTVLALPGDSPKEARVAAVALEALGRLAADNEDPADTEATIAALEAARDSTSPRAQAIAALAMPIVLLTHGRTEDAMRGIAEGLDHPDPWTRAGVRMLRGLFSENAGDVTTLRADLSQALAEFKALGERWGTATTLGALAGLMVAEGEADRALAAYEEAHALLVEIDASDDLAYIRIRIALTRLRGGDIATAREDLLRVVETADQDRSSDTKAFALAALGEVARADGDLARARALCQEALSGLERLSSFGGAPQVKAMGHLLAGRIELAEGDLVAARAEIALAYGFAVDSHDMPIASHVAAASADLALLEGDADRAGQLLGSTQALRGVAEVGDPDIIRVTAAVRATLGEKAFAEAYATGSRLTPDEALALLPGWTPGVSGLAPVSPHG